MKIFYDGYIFGEQAAGGINRYFERIIEHLPAEFSPLLVSPQRRAANWPHHPRLRTFIAPGFGPQRARLRLARHYFQAIAAWQRPDIVHPTYYRSLLMRAPDAYQCPSVITIYDFVHDIFAAQLDPQGEHARAQKDALERADALICISQNTRRDLLERFPHLESRATVTPLAGDLDVSMAFGPQKVPERPYFLFVGSRTAYKNFDGLLRAFASFAARRRDLALAVVGSAFNEAENQRIEELNIGDRLENWGHINDAHLAKLYRCSLALVYPSFYEGFGIPPLEAMSCETLVIAADNSSLPEVCGDAALLFDAADEKALVERMDAVANGLTNREAWIQKGRDRARGFSWERTAAQTTDLYRSLV